MWYTHKMNIGQSEIQINLPVAFITEGFEVVIFTPALDLSTSGKDEKEARKNFAEAVSMFFEDLVENDTLHEVLSELGWKLNENTWLPPVFSEESMQIRIPVLA